MRDEKLALGILGSTLKHSLSPQIHAAAIKFAGLDAEYEKYEVLEENFEDEIRPLLANLHGLNVTIPYKERVLNYINKVDKLAKRIGAVNTIKVNRGGLIEGYNTDYYGFQESLKGIDLKGKNATILGSGGAARAVIIALEDMGVAKIDVRVRNVDKVVNNLPRVDASELNVNLFNRESDTAEIDILINATPVGQGRLANEMPVTERQIEVLKPTAVIYDLIYSDTLLIQKAKERALKAINGAEMLVLQAAQSFSIWSGVKLSDELVAVMRSAMSLTADV
jgi:shikimate dehydrogenase